MRACRWWGFAEGRHAVGDARYFVAQGGEGPPLLLLHGFPETHACWRRIAPELTSAQRVVAPDLRGYGASEAPPGGPRGEGYTKREMAAELVQLMADPGHQRFAVVGHDRGARVAYRLALDPSRPGDARAAAQRRADDRPVRAHGRRSVTGVLDMVPARAARAVP